MNEGRPMIDRTTKALLFAIALGLWLQLASTWLKPTPVHAQNIQLMEVTDDLHRIATGVCLNGKIC
jgi:hypothetical protein